MCADRLNAFSLELSLIAVVYIYHNILRFEEVLAPGATTTCRMAGITNQLEAAGLVIRTSTCRTWADLEIPMFRSGQAKQKDPTIEAATLVHLSLRAMLLSGQDQCEDPGKRTEAAESPGTPVCRHRRNAILGALLRVVLTRIHAKTAPEAFSGYWALASPA